MRRLRILVAVLAIMALALPVSAGGREKASVNEFGTTTPTGGTASIVRTPAGVAVNVKLKDLTPGNALTVWFVHWDDLTQCAESGCTGSDLGDPGNGAIWSQIGGVVGRNGQFNQGSFVKVGEDTGGPFPLPLADPLAAEIHLVVQDHGPATGDPAQTSEFMGACNEVCDDPQAAVFKP